MKPQSLTATTFNDVFWQRLLQMLPFSLGTSNLIKVPSTAPITIGKPCGFAFCANRCTNRRFSSSVSGHFTRPPKFSNIEKVTSLMHFMIEPGTGPYNFSNDFLRWLQQKEVYLGCFQLYSSAHWMRKIAALSTPFFLRSEHDLLFVLASNFRQFVAIKFQLVFLSV